jgi:hypothetical protein
MRLFCILLLATITAEAQVLVKDVGVIGLASHDMFTWDKNQEANTENGRLDLSTIFDFNQGRNWKSGGNPKNAENAPVYTTTMELVRYYQKALKAGSEPEVARQKTVKLFHGMVRDSFERMMGLPFPDIGINQDVTNTEQASMRALHDILPGRIKLFNRNQNELIVTNVWKAKTFLNEQEMNQSIRFYDGDYDQEYLKINIPFTRKDVNLKQVDGEFIARFSPYRQEDMLEELKLVGKKKLKMAEVSFIQHLYKLFAKGICSQGNQWMPQEVICN